MFLKTQKEWKLYWQFLDKRMEPSTKNKISEQFNGVSKATVQNFIQQLIESNALILDGNSFEYRGIEYDKYQKNHKKALLRILDKNIRNSEAQKALCIADIPKKYRERTVKKAWGWFDIIPWRLR